MRVRRRARAAKSPRYLAFRPCEQCGYDIATGEGRRGCHLHACPYLPEELDVRCPTCLYNFYTQDGNPECDYPPSCEFALHVGPERVAAIKAWIAAR